MVAVGVIVEATHRGGGVLRHATHSCETVALVGVRMHVAGQNADPAVGGAEAGGASPCESARLRVLRMVSALQLDVLAHDLQDVGDDLVLVHLVAEVDRAVVAVVVRVRRAARVVPRRAASVMP